jgi:AbrB family looped-hinge helix DNA binding protein
MIESFIGCTFMIFFFTYNLVILTIIRIRKERYMALTVSAKGQVTIPKHIRDALGLSSGSRVDFVLDGNIVRLEPAESSVVDKVAGALRNYGKTSESEKVLIERVRKEVADEAAQEGRVSRHKRSA